MVGLRIYFPTKLRLLSLASRLDGKWAILFSHPADFTPVCTTELGAFARMKDEFDKRGVQMIGLVWSIATIFKHTLTDIRDSQSADPVDSHNKWIADVNEVGRTSIKFPIIADADRHIACLYDMIAEENLKNPEIAFTIRSVFIIDPNKKIRLMMLYPASTGRNTAEVLRVIDSLQTGDKNGVVTPMDWKVGDDVIVPPSVSTEEARKKFGEVREVKPYLRFAQV